MAEPMVKIEGIRFRWRPDQPLVLDIPALTAAKGERIFVRGPSGSGKTTLLNLLGGVVVPESGTVAIRGDDLARMGGAERDSFRADHVGFIFQMFNLIPYLSLIDNVVLPCRFSAARRQRIAQRGGAIEDEARRILAHLELDADALAARPVAELSMGQQQRVAAARALIGAPELVIADEPTSALDADTRRAFLDLLFREVADAGATLIFVSHDGALESAFDRSLALADLNRAGRAGQGAE